MLSKIIIAVALLLLCFTDNVHAQGRFVNIIRQAEYVVKIQDYDAIYKRFYTIGTGFYVKEKVKGKELHLIVTADHVGRVRVPDTIFAPNSTIVRIRNVPTDSVRSFITVYFNFNDGSKRPFTAALRMIDRMGDIAVYELVDFEPKDLPSPARLSRSEELEDGTEVVVISTTVSNYDVQFDKNFGFVSLAEDIVTDLSQPRLIRTSLLIHYGSSGSPLINLPSNVIGMMVAGGTVEVPGFPPVMVPPSYAVPVSDIRRVLSRLDPDSAVQQFEHGAVGDDVGLVGFRVCMHKPPVQQCHPHYGSVIVSRVPEGTLAARSGIQEGDIIQAIDDKEIKDIRDLRVIIFSYKPGDDVVLTILRFSPSKGKYVELNLYLTLGKWTSEWTSGEKQREN